MRNESPKIILLRELEKRRLENRKYSLRAFARELNISPGRLSQYLSGKRRVTKKSAEKISIHLGRSPYEKSDLLIAVEFEEKERKGLLEKDSEQLSRVRIDKDHYEIVSNPLHFAILSLFETDNFIPDVLWMSRRLKKTASEVQLCIFRLEKSGYIRRNKIGEFELSVAYGVESSDGVLDHGIRKAHRTILQETLEDQKIIDQELRDLTSMSLTFDPGKITEAKKIIRDFREFFTQKMESGKKKEVYRLNVQLVPLTRDESFFKERRTQNAHG